MAGEGGATDCNAEEGWCIVLSDPKHLYLTTYSLAIVFFTSHMWRISANLALDDFRATIRSSMNFRGKNIWFAVQADRLPNYYVCYMPHTSSSTSD